MSEEKDKKLTASSVMPGAEYEDPRPTDLDIFYKLLPGTLSGFAGKSVDARSANSMALTMVREMLGQCVAMGILRQTVQCLDGSSLAIMPAGGVAVGIPGVAGAVTQSPTQPGQGGMVSQYPNQTPPGYGAPQGGAPGGPRPGPVPGQTSNIQPIIQYPTNALAPQL